MEIPVPQQNGIFIEAGPPLLFLTVISGIELQAEE